jgi:hypothetical protein
MPPELLIGRDCLVGQHQPPSLAAAHHQLYRVVEKTAGQHRIAQLPGEREIVQIDLALDDEVVGVVDAERLRVVRRLPFQLCDNRFLQFLFEHSRYLQPPRNARPLMSVGLMPLFQIGFRRSRPLLLFRVPLPGLIGLLVGSPIRLLARVIGRLLFAHLDTSRIGSGKRGIWFPGGGHQP